MSPTQREIFTDAQIEMIRRLLSTSTMSDAAVAERFGVPVGAVKALRRSRYWDREPGLYDVGLGRRMTVSAIASLAGVTRDAVTKRIKRGLKGADLVAPVHAAPRKPRVGKKVLPARSLP